jgi:catechol 2,3-dioxygenase-like lactoylglutathione lyase family enzyme
MKPARILESALYVDDLDRSEAFYRDVLGLSVLTKVEGRHVFFRCGDGVLLLFDPSKTVQAPAPDARLPVPPHGAGGDGHLCFGATEREIEQWKKRLAAAGVAIEADFEWPQGGRSIYFRDPAGNSIEFANPRIWGIPGRRIEDREIVVASHNKGKLSEIADLIGPFGLTARSAAEHGLPEPEETGTTFEEQKRPACRHSRTIPACASTPSTAHPASTRPTGQPRPTAAATSATPCGRRRTGWLQPGRFPTSSGRDGSYRSSALPGRTAMRSTSAARLRERWSGRRAVTGASATIRCSARKASTSPSAR